jgi:phospholipid N-methyltransferase
MPYFCIIEKAKSLSMQNTNNFIQSVLNRKIVSGDIVQIDYTIDSTQDRYYKITH